MRRSTVAAWLGLTVSLGGCTVDFEPKGFPGDATTQRQAASDQDGGPQDGGHTDGGHTDGGTLDAGSAGGGRADAALIDATVDAGPPPCGTATNPCDACGSPPAAPTEGSQAAAPEDGPPQTVTYACNDGFALSGQRRLFCQRDGSWNDAPPTCVASECGDLDPIENGQLELDSAVAIPGAMATLRCDDGYALSGPEASTCETDGTWSPVGGCADVDECADGTAGCDTLTDCVNLPGSFRCGDCPTGYAGTGDVPFGCVPRLLNLETLVGRRTPAFSPERLIYTVAIPVTRRSVELVWAAPEGTEVAIDGVVTTGNSWVSPPLSLGDTAVRLTVLRPGGDQTAYRWTLRRTPAERLVKAKNGEAGDLMGTSVAIDGDTLVVGAPSEDGTPGNADSDNNAASAGAAYVFVRQGSGWTEQARLKASNGERGDLFGNAVAISGDTIVVGAYAEDGAFNAPPDDNTEDSAGAAYVFTRSGNTWTETTRLKATPSAAGDEFGETVAIDGDTIVVGAEREDSIATNSGAAFVFARNGRGTWSQEARLKASNAGNSDLMGSAVAIDGNTVVAGAWAEDSAGAGTPSDNTARSAGAVYVFVRNGRSWREQALLKANDAEASDFFGRALAIEGDTVVVGAEREDGMLTDPACAADGCNEGAAYVFGRSGNAWRQQARLKPSSGDASDFFGVDVAIEGDLIVVGAEREDGTPGSAADDNGRTNSGAVYLFRRDEGKLTWTEDARLKASGARPSDFMGAAVAITGDTVVAGTPRQDSSPGAGPADNSAPNSGAAYLFE